MRSLLEAALLLIGMAAAWSPVCAAAGSGKPPVPDLTQGGKPDQSHDWQLGPTGARGWVWGWRCQTTDARQILITAVAKGSPADGVLEKGDVITGINGQAFGGDARILFAQAITEAEKEANGGMLRLVRWRADKTENVALKLPVMGTYAPTAPYNCAKSKRIFEQGCQAIAKLGFKDNHGVIRIEIANALRALALLASGRAEYRPLVAEYAKAVAACTPSQGGHKCWDYGYETTFLAEYVLATEDASVMPGLTRLAMDIARGASGVGTWGHSFARPTDKILDGYGCMNQPGIVLTLAMVLAREAGVKDPDLDNTITKASGFLRWWVNKGAVPYGDHDPWPWHDDNGKCSSAAVLFDLLGDREAAAFYSRMGTAAYGERESGHTGNFFNITWALPGVSRCGPAATAAYLKETTWYYDLARGWDGRFDYLGLPGEGRENYSGWDCTGAFLLGYALPLKSLYLTGRKPGVAPVLSGDEVTATIEAGRDFTFWNERNCYEGRKTEALVAGLSSWSSAVRKRSAQALSLREGDFVPKLLEFLASPKPESRYGACEALGLLGPKADPAAPQVRALLTDKDPWLRILAAETLVRMGPEVRKAVVPDLLRAASLKDPADRRDRFKGALAEALFTPSPGKREPKSILSGSLDGVDRPLLYAAIKELLTNEDGRIRGLVAPVYPLLSPEDAKALLPEIVKAIREPAPSGEMFAYGIRFAGLDLLARLRIREGMPLCVDIMNEFRWGRQLSRCIAPLTQYGGAAQEALPRIREVRQKMAATDKNWEKKDNDLKRDILAVDKLIAAIEADKNPAPVRSMEEFSGTRTSQ
ncbi:MAG: DUF6288 domain-containing protein [Planctomycetota bacterium]